MADLARAPRREDGAAPAPGGVRGASAMTLLERDAYLNRCGVIDVTHGYPQGRTPQWIRQYQEHPPEGFLDVPPGEYMAVICDWFARFLGCGSVSLLAPDCTKAFTIAAQALIREPGDEIVLTDTSFEVWPEVLAALGARARYARRGAGGLPDPDSIAGACTQRTRAVVIVSPDNPLGTICPRDVFGQIAALCAGRRLALLADHSLAAVNPLRRDIPLLPRLAAVQGLPWLALADTGKILGLAGHKFAAVACSAGLQQRLEAAASIWGFQHRQYDLALLAGILGDPRFLPYRLGLSDHIGSMYLRLREQVRPPLTVAPLDAGCFALIDAAGLGLDDVSYARVLADRYSTLVVPLSWSPAGRPARDTRVRASLNRAPAVIGQLTEALNASAASLAR
jgi:aspartate/methionine/tyrosine aminotransferase